MSKKGMIWSAAVAVLLLIGAGVSWASEGTPLPGVIAPAGRTIVVRAVDDGGRFRFEPADVEVRRGDVIRFVQEGAMPHNVAFVKNTAPTGVDLGELWTGPYMMTRTDSYEIYVDERFADGTYDFICTPHAALGMAGTITVSGQARMARRDDASAPGGGGSAHGDISDLPTVTDVHGAQELEYTMDGDVKVFRMTVERIQWETKPGTLVEAWTFNRMIPGPTIRATEGERVRIVVTNQLPEGTSAHWHGLEVPNNMDGVPGISQDPIMPGDSFVYEFEAKPAGTHLFHSHFNSLHQEEHGLYGMFIVDPRGGEPRHMQADREEIMILGDGPLGFVINGKEFPEIQPIEVERGELVRVRMANLGGLYHPMHLHGGHFSVVAKDGFELPAPQRMNTISIAPGETFDVMLRAEEPGTWLWHCHVLSHVTGPKDANGDPTVAGMVGVVQVGEATVDVANHRH